MDFEVYILNNYMSTSFVSLYKSSCVDTFFTLFGTVFCQISFLFVVCVWVLDIIHTHQVPNYLFTYILFWILLYQLFYKIYGIFSLITKYFASGYIVANSNISRFVFENFLKLLGCFIIVTIKNKSISFIHQ